MLPCFLLDLFELQEMVCLTKHGAALSLCLTSQGVPNAQVMMNKKCLSCDCVIRPGLLAI